MRIQILESIRPRLASGILLAVTFFASATQANIDVFVTDLGVTGGFVYGNAVILPVGESVTIGTRIEGPIGVDIFGMGLSYYGYDNAVIGFLDGDRVDGLYCEIYFGGRCFNGMENLVGATLFESTAAPSSVPLVAGPTRVRVFSHISYLSSDGFVPESDAGLDGLAGNPNGDAHFRLSFEGLSDGYTEIEVGTGDDLGGAVFGPAYMPLPAANNATIRIAVPEPSSVSGMIAAVLFAMAFRGRN